MPPKLTVHGGHDEADLCRIRGAGEMCVDLLALVLVQADEAVQDVVARSAVVVATLVIGEVVLHGADGQLLLEPIDLVEEENDGRLDEPAGVADGVEQSEGLLHAVDRLVFEQQLVVLGDSDQEQDGGDVLEAVDPLLPLRPLATDVEHAVRELTDDEGRLGDTGRLDTRSQDVLVVGHVVGRRDTRDIIEVAAESQHQRNAIKPWCRQNLLSRRVVQLVFP